MELDRHFIERNDFSAVRRGYDPEEVDRHLAEIAESVQDLKRQAKGSPSTVAAQAAEQVRGIVDAAERSAREITEGAEAEARKIVEEANQRARETREKADGDALDRVQAAEDATQSVLDRANTVNSEVDRMLEDARGAADALAGNLRSSAESLQTELDAIRGELAGVRDARLEDETAGGRVSSASTTGLGAVAEPTSVEPSEFDDEGPVDAEPEIVVEVEETIVGTNGDGSAVDEDPADALEVDATEEEHSEEPAGGRSIRGAEGARLIALNMALNGTPRDETARYLEQNFDLENQDELLDEVYARVGD